jgi:hypothetical protein
MSRHRTNDARSTAGSATNPRIGPLWWHYALIDSAAIISQMALDPERVIRGMRAGGLTFDQLEHAWSQALSHIKQIDHGD